ncbi:MAG: GrpB family protein [Candidatus Limnocylindrales bacterium]
MSDDRDNVDRATAREAEIKAAWVVSEPPRLDGTVTLVEYDPRWPLLFGREDRRIRDALGVTVVQLEHTGSTAVPGLAAKPIVDMLLVVGNSSEEAAYLPPLVAAGYRLVIREPEWHEHRLFKGPDTNVNLHVLSSGSPEIERILAFRDWLRSHDDDRQRYEATKRELAARKWAYIQNYADAKSEVVESIIAKAHAARG